MSTEKIVIFFFTETQVVSISTIPISIKFQIIEDVQKLYK